MRLFQSFVLAAILITPLLGYNPPVDTAGPLTVRMQPPAVGAYGAGGYVDLSRPGVPFQVPVSLQNASDQPLSGTLRVAVIDKWKVEPAAPIPFNVGPRGRARFEFTISFGPGTHSAHYPIHAYADFEYQGKKLTAHPVMIVQTRIPDASRPKLPVEWKPVPVPKGGTLGLWRMPVRRESIQIANEGADAGQGGREVFDAGSVILYGPLLRKEQPREGINITLGKRPPSLRETVEGAAVEYPLALPAVKPLRLDFAFSGDAEFEVKAVPIAGSPATSLFRRRGQGEALLPAGIDLSKFAGSAIRLRLEASGASGEAQFAEPTISAGDPPRAPAFPPSGGQGKLLGKADQCEVRVWPGSRGLLDAPVGFVCGDRKLYFRGFHVRVTGDALEQWRASTELLAAVEETASGRHRVRHRFRNWAGNFDLLSELWVERDGLRARFWIENQPESKPWFHLHIESLSVGAWSETVDRIYGGHGNVIVRPKAFRLGYNGHYLSTSFVGFDFAGGQAMVLNSDAVPDRLEVDPEAKFYSLVTPHAQTLEFFPASNVFEAVKRLREQDTRKPASGVAKLAGRFTFDIWNGRYADRARDLERAAQYGVRDAMVVWHRWQRWGYDYRLPDIYPPDPALGSMEDFQLLVETCKRNGNLFAPHDNYIDFYPDFEGFTYKSIAFRQNGSPYRAWFNYAQEAQSYRARPETVWPYVKRNLSLIKEGFAPTAYFIDVWSSTGPYDYWTEDGQFRERGETRRVWGEVFAWIREFLGNDAPQVSEAGHDKLIGWLDGADAQHMRVDPNASSFTWRIECEDWQRIPWMDVAWHDKFILYGAGYEGRYVGGLDVKAHGAYSDDYISTEVLTGRPGMVPQTFNRNVIRKYWLINDAMKALALDRIASVEFAGNNIHRQHVRWERGGQVWVNRGAEPWTVEGHTLPRYGFYLRIGEVEAAVETRNGQRVEWSRSPGKRYEGGKLTLASGSVMELPPE